MKPVWWIVQMENLISSNIQIFIKNSSNNLYSCLMKMFDAFAPGLTDDNQETISRKIMLPIFYLQLGHECKYIHTYILNKYTTYIIHMKKKHKIYDKLSEATCTPWSRLQVKYTCRRDHGVHVASESLF